MTLVQVTRHGTAALIRLDDPKRRNILSPALCRELSAAVANANADLQVKAIVITGAAPAFCAGADLNDLKAAAGGNTEALHAVYQSFTDVANSPLPTIAAVNGAAVGAGMNLALACDMRLASEDASFDTRFLKIGLHPGGGHAWMLLRAVGWAQATRLLLLGRSVRAEDALAIGLVDWVEALERLVEVALEWANCAESLPRELIVATKGSLRLAAASDHATAFAHETEAQKRSLHQPPFAELVRRLQASIKAG